MKTENIPRKFRALYIFGLLLCFLSLFLEWYIYQVYDSSNHLQAYWIYNPLTGWSTFFSKGSTLNYKLRPTDLEIPLALTMVYIGMLALAVYSVVFQDVEQHPKPESLSPYAYCHMFLLILMLFYIFAFPVFYLIPNNLYFPFLYVKDKEAGLMYCYSIGPGYALQLLGFLMAVPYALFYYNTVMKFQSRQHSASSMIKNYIDTIQETVDMDKLIAREQLKLKLGEDTFEDLPELQRSKIPPHKRRAEP